MKSHCMSSTTEYKSWKAMRQRCNNPKDAAYPRYGGIGIKVCKRWDSFVLFYKDLGPKPKGFSIERIENTKGYTPSNCVWANDITQIRNRKNTVRLTIKGRTLTLQEWADECGVSYDVLRERIKRYGWSPEAAMLQGNPNKRMITAFGETRSVADWSRKSGTEYSVLISRLCRGWLPERAIRTTSGINKLDLRRMVGDARV